MTVPEKNKNICNDCGSVKLPQRKVTQPHYLTMLSRGSKEEETIFNLIRTSHLPFLLHISNFMVFVEATKHPGQARQRPASWKVFRGGGATDERPLILPGHCYLIIVA